MSGGWVTYQGIMATVYPPPGRQPSSETGIYLRKHAHRWRESGAHVWPSGASDPMFECVACRDVICCAAVATESPR